jgi:hypothetical protein
MCRERMLGFGVYGTVLGAVRQAQAPLQPTFVK